MDAFINGLPNAQVRQRFVENVTLRTAYKNTHNLEIAKRQLVFLPTVGASQESQFSRFFIFFFIVFLWPVTAVLTKNASFHPDTTIQLETPGVDNMRNLDIFRMCVNLHQALPKYFCHNFCLSRLPFKTILYVNNLPVDALTDTDIS